MQRIDFGELERLKVEATGANTTTRIANSAGGAFPNGSAAQEYAGV